MRKMTARGDEKSPAEPSAETSKILVETEKILLKHFNNKKFPALILRVAGIYGPERGQWFKQFLKGQAQIEGNGSRFLNMIHRDDLVGCIIAALKNGRAGEIYNAVDDEPVTQLNFFQWLAETLGKNLPSPTPENLERRRGVTNKRVSNAKLKAELKYEFQFPDFRAGYAAEIARLKSSGADLIFRPPLRRVRRCGCGRRLRSRRRKLCHRRFCRSWRP